MDLKLTNNQAYVIKAICELRIVKGGTHNLVLEHAWVEDKTSELKSLDGETKTGKVARQQWTAPFGDSKTEKIWKLIGEAVRGRLPHNDPIEKKIRDCKSADSALVVQLRQQIDQLEKKTEQAIAAQKKAEDNLHKYKTTHYNEQCTDAYYKINFQKIIARNTGLVKAAKSDRDTINGLLCEVSNLNSTVNKLEAKLGDECLNIINGAESFRKPQVFEPRLNGRNNNIEDEDLLRSYEIAINTCLDSLQVVANKLTPDITIVFHNFNVDIKSFIADGKVPFRSVRFDNLIFACHGVSPEIRTGIFRRIATLTTSYPQVVIITGKEKIERLPVKERGELDNHEWFIERCRMGAYRPRQINPLTEGYDIVVYRRLDDGY